MDDQHAPKSKRRRLDPPSPGSDLRITDLQELQSTLSRRPTSGRVYPIVHLSGNSQAILGDFGGSSSSFFRNNSDEVSKRLILNALYFEGMQSRRDQVAARAGSPKYIEWVWGTSFNAWLQSPDSFYWITGCPGSGKSTLMKHISESRKTLDVLQANGQKWTTVHFFFDFRAKVETANTIEGLLRSLLYQLADRLPEVAKYLEFTFSSESLSENGPHDYMNSLCDAIQRTSTKICAFIDGLDEFAGPGSDLLEAIHSLEDRSSIKICIASRPYPVFEDNLSGYQHLVMQDHNSQSIQLYTKAQFKSHRIVGVATLPRQLADKIHAKARGVFLWARLATDELLRGLLAGKSMAELELLLEQMPQEVQEMYQRILDRLPEVLKVEAALLLYILTESRGPVEVRKLFIAMNVVASKLSTSQMIQPVDEDSDNDCRLLALLGDFVDVSNDQRKDASIDTSNKVTTFIFGRSGIRIRKAGEPIPQARLTHETLHTYLTDSKWLDDNLSPHSTIIKGPRFWFNLYLDELLRCLDRCEALPSVTLERHRSFLKKSTRYLNDLIKADVLDNSAIDKITKAARMRARKAVLAEAVELLELWKEWTPLLSYALQEIFTEEKLGVKNPCDERFDDMQRFLQSPLAWLHRLICMYQRTDLIRYGDAYTVTGEEGRCFKSRSHGQTESLTLLDPCISIPLCHGMPSSFMQSFCEDPSSISPEMRQPLFDMVCSRYSWSNQEQEWGDLLLLLADTNSHFAGMYLCEFLRREYGDCSPGSYSSVPTAVCPGSLAPDRPGSSSTLQRLSDLLKYHHDARTVLTEHRFDCKFYGGLVPEVGFLSHWADKIEGVESADEEVTALFKLLVTDREHLNQIAAPIGEPLLNVILSGNQWFVTDGTMLKFVLAVQAGANPYVVGRSGTAFDVAKTELRKLRQRDSSQDVNKRKALQMEKIVELLEYYASHDGQLPQDLDEFLKFKF